jgi:hypothetical protein
MGIKRIERKDWNQGDQGMIYLKDITIRKPGSPVNFYSK